MAAVDFPSNPVNGQTFTSQGKTWTYNGTGWALSGAATGVTSAAAPAGYNSGTGQVSVSGTVSEFNAALVDGDFATVTGAETLSNKTLTAPVVTVATNVQTGNYVLALSDASKVVEMNVGSANTVTVPEDASVNFPVGSQIEIVQIGTGQTEIIAGGSATILSPGPGNKVSARYGKVTLYKSAANMWVLNGNLAA